MTYIVSAIIPSYNEQKNIKSLIYYLLKINSINEIICVDDGSTDNTLTLLKDIEKETNRLKVISLIENHGKSYAIAQGLLQAKGDIVILLDADLVGVNEETINALLNPILQGNYDCVVGYPSKTLDVFFKPISGQRAYFKKDILPLVERLKDKGYGLELFLNFSFSRKRVKSIVLSGVSHIMKHRKFPLLKAVKYYAGEIGELVSEIFYQEDPFSYFSKSYIYPFYLQKETIRVLFIFDSISPIGGGSQVSALTWMENLQKHGIIIKLLCNENAFQFVREIKKEDVISLPYINLDKFFPKYYPTLFLNSDIRRKIKNFSPEIIHFHEPTIFAYQIMQYAKKHNIKTVFSFQTDFLRQKIIKFPWSLIMGKNNPVLKFFSTIQNKLCMDADVVLALTKYYQKMLATKLNKRVYLIRPPIKNIFFQPKTTKHNAPKNLLAVGRLVHGKHVDTLINMMKYLENEFHLVLIGDGPDKDYILSMIKKLHLDNVITYKNWLNINDLPKEFSSTDLYLSASDSETFGLTYISALATGIPCVVYDYEVSREVIPEGMGIFIRSFDPKVWANNIMQLKQKSENFIKLQEKIKENYKLIKQYDEKYSTKSLIKVYKSILRKNNK